MASIYRRPRSPHWWVKFKDHRGEIARVSSNTGDEATARALADDLQEAADLARTGKGAIAAGGLSRLVELGYWATDTPTPPPRRHNPLTLESLALAHPAVARERLTRPGDHRVHMAHLREFSRQAGVDDIRGLTGHAARWYLDRLVADRMTREQIRHRLLYLRAAAAMATEFGVPNVLTNLRAPRNTANAAAPQALALESARLAVATCKNPRLRLGMALMACMGLRLSEVCRLRWADLSADVLHVGAHGAKTEASNRLLPVAPPLLAMLEDWRSRRLRYIAKHRWLATDMSPVILTRWHRYQVQELAPREIGRSLAAHLPDGHLAKDLRRTFATVATWDLGIPAEVVEAFMGRRISTLGAVTARHYLARAHVDRLRPHAETVAGAILQGTQPGHTDLKSSSASASLRPSKP